MQFAIFRLTAFKNCHSNRTHVYLFMNNKLIALNKNTNNALGLIFLFLIFPKTLNFQIMFT